MAAIASGMHFWILLLNQTADAKYSAADEMENDLVPVSVQNGGEGGTKQSSFGYLSGKEKLQLLSFYSK